jgi:hypothetical protein
MSHTGAGIKYACDACDITFAASRGISCPICGIEVGVLPNGSLDRFILPVLDGVKQWYTCIVRDGTAQYIRQSSLDAAKPDYERDPSQLQKMSATRPILPGFKVPGFRCPAFGSDYRVALRRDDYGYAGCLVDVGYHVAEYGAHDLIYAIGFIACDDDGPIHKAGRFRAALLHCFIERSSGSGNSRYITTTWAGQATQVAPLVVAVQGRSNEMGAASRRGTVPNDRVTIESLPPGSFRWPLLQLISDPADWQQLNSHNIAQPRNDNVVDLSRVLTNLGLALEIPLPSQLYTDVLMQTICVTLPMAGALLPQLRTVSGWSMHRHATYTVDHPLWFTADALDSSIPTFSLSAPPFGLADLYLPVPGHEWLRAYYASPDHNRHTAIGSALAARRCAALLPELFAGCDSMQSASRRDATQGSLRRSKADDEPTTKLCTDDTDGSGADPPRYSGVASTAKST